MDEVSAMAEERVGRWAVGQQGAASLLEPQGGLRVEWRHARV